MNGVVRVGAYDSHIRYSGEWSGRYNTTMTAFDSLSEFFMMFRGSIMSSGPMLSLFITTYTIIPCQVPASKFMARGSRSPADL